MEFKNRVTQFPNRKRMEVIQSVDDNNFVVNIIEDNGVVTEEGTELNAENLNRAFQEAIGIPQDVICQGGDAELNYLNVTTAHISGSLSAGSISTQNLDVSYDIRGYNLTASGKVNVKDIEVSGSLKAGQFEIGQCDTTSRISGSLNIGQGLIGTSGSFSSFYSRDLNAEVISLSKGAGSIYANYMNTNDLSVLTNTNTYELNVGSGGLHVSGNTTLNGNLNGSICGDIEFHLSGDVMLSGCTVIPSVAINDIFVNNGSLNVHGGILASSFYVDYASINYGLSIGGTYGQTQLSSGGVHTSYLDASCGLQVNGSTTLYGEIYGSVTGNINFSTSGSVSFSGPTIAPSIYTEHILLNNGLLNIYGGVSASSIYVDYAGIDYAGITYGLSVGSSINIDNGKTFLSGYGISTNGSLSAQSLAVQDGVDASYVDTHGGNLQNIGDLQFYDGRNLNNELSNINTKIGDISTAIQMIRRIA